MKRRLKLFLIVPLIVWIPSPVSGQARAALGAKSPAAKAQAASDLVSRHPALANGIKMLETWIETHMAYNQMPGLSIGIVYDQELIWAKGFGHGDVEKQLPATPETVYRLGSITKLFTATAIMQLRDQGKLQMDDPITRYLPWFKMKNQFPDAPPITIRHLLTHSSGLPTEAAFPYWTDNNFPTMEQIKESLPNQEAVFPPETRMKYSNLGFTLLGEIVSVVSGMSYADYIRKNIFDPLGMSSSRVVDGEEHDKVATGYGPRARDGKRKIRPYQELKGISPAGNMSSNVIDLARFASVQFGGQAQQGKPILKSSTIKEMHRPQWLRADWRSGFGLGFSIRNSGDRVYVGHEGILSGYRSRIRISPQEKLAVIVLMNSDDADTSTVTDQAFRLISPALAGLGGAAPKVAQADPAWNNYTGKYSDSWGDYQVMVLGNDLVLITLTSPDPISSAVRLVPTGKDRFRIAARSPDASNEGDQVSFELGPDGKVSRIKIDQNYAVRQD